MAAAIPVIKVAALSGSLRNLPSIQASSVLESEKGIQIEHIDISQLPLLNTDLIVSGTYPPVVEAFRQQILKAETPLKNAIDWASVAPNCWEDKAAAVVSAGGGFGGGRSQYHLRQIGVYLDLHFINKPEFFLNGFQPPAKFDDDGNLIDAEAKQRLEEILVTLRDFTLRLQK
ncbi:hypothetical protein GH714_017436 [Hevea brasiliensis]|uniref:NAD(P)H dehydrogenase (quinone) n=1 Tax=Hevea brasiliensis TaxID=3981 RepID=A0A6A6N8K1_HEVBR|nr:hypothetical protein GH714_017436 [Hevea brasiliensis]